MTLSGTISWLYVIEACLLLLNLWSTYQYKWGLHFSAFARCDVSRQSHVEKVKPDCRGHLEMGGNVMACKKIFTKWSTTLAETTLTKNLGVYHWSNCPTSLFLNSTGRFKTLNNRRGSTHPVPDIWGLGRPSLENTVCGPQGPQLDLNIRWRSPLPYIYNCNWIVWIAGMGLKWNLLQKMPISCSK